MTAKMGDLTAKVDDVIETVHFIVQFMQEKVATKYDLVSVATKDDLNSMATKDDLANMATKDDLGELRAEMHANFREVRVSLSRLDERSLPDDNVLATEIVKLQKRRKD